MDPYTSIITRNSIRHFSKETVSRNLIEKIITAAACAPSAKNRQPWFFVIIKEKEIKQKIYEILLESRKKQYCKSHFYNACSDEAVKKAPFSVLVCYDKSKTTNQCDSDKLLLSLKEEQGVAAAIENLLLASHALGLGSFWLSSPIYAQDEIQTLLGLPDTLKPRAIVPIGRSKNKRRIKKIDIDKITKWF